MARKAALNVRMSEELLESLKRAAYWTPGETITSLVERFVADGLGRIERKRGEPFPQRTGTMPTGRQMK